MAERCGLFIIIALGKSILITGADLRRPDLERGAAVAAFVVAFLGSVAMWVVYFNIGAERGSSSIAASDDPGRIGAQRLHLSAHPDRRRHHRRGGRRRTGAAPSRRPHRREDRRRHPRRAGALSARQRAVQAALRAIFPAVAYGWTGRLLALLVPAAMVVSPLLLSALTTAVLIVVVTWEWISLRQRAAST